MLGSTGVPLFWGNYCAQEGTTAERKNLKPRKAWADKTEAVQDIQPPFRAACCCSLQKRFRASGSIPQRVHKNPRSFHANLQINFQFDCPSLPEGSQKWTI